VIRLLNKIFAYLARLFSVNGNCTIGKLQLTLACVSVTLHNDQSLAGVDVIELADKVINQLN